MHTGIGKQNNKKEKLNKSFKKIYLKKKRKWKQRPQTGKQYLKNTLIITLFYFIHF